MDKDLLLAIFLIVLIWIKTYYSMEEDEDDE